MFVNISRYEALGSSLIEASHLNKPIVTTDFNPAFSLVDNNKTGIITVKWTEAISEAIIRLYTNKSKYNQMVRNLETEIFDKSNLLQIKLI